MATLFLQFFAAALVIAVAGTFLTRYADAIGQHTGLGRTLAGMVLLATATSLPELAVNCNLAYQGRPDLAVGDLLGASLFNLLILAILDLVHRGPQRMLSPLAAAHALSATMTVMMTATCLLFVVARLEITFAGIGPGPILLTVFYLLGLRLVYFNQQYAAEQRLPFETPSDDEGARPSLRRAAIGYGVAMLAIFLAAPVLAFAAEGLAEQTGLGGTFIGTTLVAFSTTLPEFVTTLTAVRSGAYDLAVGNVFGSNTFNMVILLPVDGFFDGSILSAASTTHAVTAACVIIITSVVVLGLLYRPEKRYWVIEPDALLVIVLVIASLGLVYHLR